MKFALKSISAATALLFAAALPAAQAETAVLTKFNAETAANKSAVAEFWTAERFAAAKPLPLPQAKRGAATEAKSARGTEPTDEPAGSDAQPPAEEPVPSVEQLFVPSPAAGNQLRGAAPEPQDAGTFGAYFTSSRVKPMYTGAGAAYSADRAYPYRTVGKLFFAIEGRPYVCSAAIIQRRVISTAGHCVHSGSGGAAGFFSNFVFVPAFRDGAAPFYRWNWRQVSVTSTWATGGGVIPNAADYAMIVLADQPVATGGAPVRIGNYLGWLGWQTLNLIPNHTTKLGYPLNLDNGQKMQEITSQSFRSSAPNNVEYGTDAGGGSSGGPWVKNFSVTATGGATGVDSAPNRVIGVTSYGYVDPSRKVQGSSIPDNRWVAVWNAVCAGAGNCAP